MCKERLSNTCGGSKTPVRCLGLDGLKPNAYSQYSSNDCIDGYEVLEDIYKQLTTVQDGLDNSALTSDCILEIPEKQNELNQVFLDKICEILAAMAAASDPDAATIDSLSLTPCDFDFGTLVDVCGDPITTLCQLLQKLIVEANKVTALEDALVVERDRIDALETTLNALVTTVNNL
jgi:hypothetical protein